MHNSHKNKLGFTIIEVVLVLAIAGLIFLMVFIALPALQRSQRNTEYRNRVSMMITMLDRYKANNRGRYPESTGSDGIRVGNTSTNADHGFYSYVQNSGMSDGTFVKVIPVIRSFTLPDYGILLTSPATGDVHYGRVVAIINGECDSPSGGQNGFSFTHSVGKTSVFTLLEEGEYGTVYCQVI